MSLNGSHTRRRSIRFKVVMPASGLRVNKFVVALKFVVDSFWKVNVIGVPGERGSPSNLVINII